MCCGTRLTTYVLVLVLGLAGIYKTADGLAKTFEKRVSKLKKTGKRKRGGESAQRAEVKEATRVDRLRFSQLVHQLSSDQLGKVVAVLQQRCPSALTEENEDELEIEINNIDAVTLFQLNQYAGDCIADNTSAKKKRR